MALVHSPLLSHPYNNTTLFAKKRATVPSSTHMFMPNIKLLQKRKQTITTKVRQNIRITFRHLRIAFEYACIILINVI